MKWTNRGHEFDKIGENFKNKQIIFYDMAEDTFGAIVNAVNISPEIKVFLLLGLNERDWNR